MAEVGTRQSAYPALQPRGCAEAARVGSGFPFGRLTGRWSLCLLAATFTAVLPMAAQAEQWPTTDWEPICYEDRLSTSACDLEDDGVAVVIEQLREASRYFQTLGFRPPVIARPNGSDPARPYPVYLEEDRFYPGEVRSLEATGAYYPPEFLRVAYGDYFAYDPEEFFAFGTESDGHMYTATHELFHAIQEAYGMRELFDGKGGEWIVEGTAVAAEAVRTENIDFFPLTPFLDYPLYALRTRGGQESSYLSYPFWLYVADRYGGGLPDGIAVLHDFFRAAPEFSGRRTAIDIVDGSLRQFNEDGLYDIYPAFIAEYGADERRYMEVTRHDVLPPEDAAPARYNLEIAG